MIKKIERHSIGFNGKFIKEVWIRWLVDVNQSLTGTRTHTENMWSLIVRHLWKNDRLYRNRISHHHLCIEGKCWYRSSESIFSKKTDFDLSNSVNELCWIRPSTTLAHLVLRNRLDDFRESKLNTIIVKEQMVRCLFGLRVPEVQISSVSHWMIRLWTRTWW